MSPTPDPVSPPAAVLARPPQGPWSVSGHWTVYGLGRLPVELQAQPCPAGPLVLDGSALAAMDSAGAWVLQRWLMQGATQGQSQGQMEGQSQPPTTFTLLHWPAPWQALMARMAEHGLAPPLAAPSPGLLERRGRATLEAARQAQALLVFIGQVTVAALGVLRHPARLRWRTVLRHIQIGGFDALPLIGLMSFLLGVVVAYQASAQLRSYGANVLVVDLVGFAMLREFAPLMTAILIAGRSGSAYAAQIGTMVVTEEVDALRTIGINPLELLVLPKVLALLVVMPLLTVFADITGVLGGMVMARSELHVGMVEFAQRFGRQMQGPALLLGVGKSLVFAVVIVVIGCFQGFRTRGSADSVGRHTTLSVVQSIFIVIVADALFSVVFNMLDL